MYGIVDNYRTYVKAGKEDNNERDVQEGNVLNRRERSAERLLGSFLPCGVEVYDGVLLFFTVFDATVETEMDAAVLLILALS